MGKNILIIDDNEQDRKIMTKLIKKAGYEDISTAGTAEEGLSHVISKRPDLVIVDTMLPGTDGFELCRQIREKQVSYNPKVIIITGSIDAVDAVKAKRVGADDYCAKNTDFSVLIDAIKGIC